MNDFIECCLTHGGSAEYNDAMQKGVYNICDMDKKALRHVLPVILKQELTERQRLCLKMKYVSNLKQDEISKKLHLSQPTVSRHISTAKKVVNNRLQYCIEAVKALDNEWLKTE